MGRRLTIVVDDVDMVCALDALAAQAADAMCQGRGADEKRAEAAFKSLALSLVLGEEHDTP